MFFRLKAPSSGLTRAYNINDVPLKKNYSKAGLITLINLLYFQVGLLVSIISALIPNILDSYHLSYGLGATLPFAFYISFTFLCIPTGIANERFSPKSVIVFSLLLALAGSLLFALFPNYYFSVISLFIIGSATAILQVSAVPLLRSVCGAEKLAFHSTLNQLLYGAGAFVSPNIYSYLTSNLVNKDRKSNFIFDGLARLVPVNYEWIAAYWLFAFLIIVTLLILWFTQFPDKDTASGQPAEERGSYRQLLKNKYVIFYFIALTAYTSCEQGVAVWMSKFFQVYHHVDPLKNGASILSWYWILLSGGCLAGLLLLKFFDSRKVLAVFTLMAIGSFTAGLYGNIDVAKIAFPMVGLFASVMFPIILSLAVNSVARHHELLTGFMYTATVGAALGPFIIGVLSDHGGLRFGFHYIYLALGIILSVPFWARPLMTGKRVE